MGCGYISVIDEHQRVFAWGDNYAVRKFDFLILLGLAWDWG
jgi:hypothetical protein